MSKKDKKSEDFNEVQEDRRQELIKEDEKMHEESGDPSPYPSTARPIVLPY